MNYAFLIFQVWTILSVFGFILIFYRKDSFVIFEEWRTTKSEQNIFKLFITICLIYLILPISIPFSISHIRLK